jgi:acetyl-CoA synthetase
MIGKIVRSECIDIVPDMPKTRISNHMDTGDIISLANPDIVEQIRELVQSRNVGPLQGRP